MYKKITGVLALFLLTGCLSETVEGPVDIIPLNSPIDSNNGILHQNKGNIIGEYNRRIPRDPREWRKLNKDQTNALERLGRGG